MMQNATLKFYFYLLFLFFCNLDAFSQAQRKILFEDFTGSWCGLCPEGHVTFDKVLEEFEDRVVGVGIHISDPMSNLTTEQLSDAYSGGGINVFLLDRFLFEGNQFIQFDFQYDAIAENLERRLEMTSPVSVHIEDVKFNPDTRLLSANVQAEFHSEVVTSDWRLNLWIIEDSVSLMETGYHQVNFFDNYAGHTYQGAGNPIQGFVHRNVLRTAMGNAWGTPNSIEARTIEIGESFSYKYTTILDENWDADQIELVALVQEYNEDKKKRSIINTENITLNTALDDPTTISAVRQLTAGSRIFYAYPNPINTQSPLSIEFSLDQATFTQVAIYDVNGRLVEQLHNDELSTGKHHLQWNACKQNNLCANSGIYWLVVQTEKGRFVEKIVSGL